MRISDWSSDVCSSDLKLRVEIGFGGLVAAHRRKGHEEPSHDESFLEEGNQPLAVSGLRIVGPRALVSRRTPAYQSRSIFMSCGCYLPHPSLSEKSCSPRRARKVVGSGKSVSGGVG